MAATQAHLTSDIRHPTSAQPPAGWLRIDEAALRLNVTSSALRRRARESLLAESRALQCGGAWWFSPAILSPPKPAAPAVDVELLQQLSPARLARATQRAAAVERFCAAIDAADRHTPVVVVARATAAALRQEQPEFRVSARSLFAWRKALRAAGGAVTALADQRAPERARHAGHPFATDLAARSPEAIRFFLSLDRTENRKSIRWSHERTVQEAQRCGWHWAPSLRATQVWLARYDNRGMRFLARDGWKLWMKRYGDYVEQDYADIRPGQLFVADHKVLDLLVRVPGGRATRLVRPWLTAIMDVASRMVVGWELSLAPNQDTILAAIRRAFLGFGVPEVLKIDNGKDFASTPLTGATKAQRRTARADTARREADKPVCDSPLWRGVVQEAGAEVMFALPFNPQSKSIERFFGTLNDLCRDYVSYVGGTPADKPESLPDRLRVAPRHVPTIDDLHLDLRVWLDAYHARAHQGAGMNGLSPREKWTMTEKSIRVAESAALDLLLMVRGPLRVGANGVALRVGSATLRYGRDSASLRVWKGREVLIALDPHDLSRVLVLTPARVPLPGDPWIACNDRLSPMARSEDVRAAIRNMRAAQAEERRVRSRAPAAATNLALEVRRGMAEQRDRLAATGTDDGRPADDTTTLRPVITGLESAVAQLRMLPPPPGGAADIVDLSALPDARRTNGVHCPAESGQKTAPAFPALLSAGDEDWDDEAEYDEEDDDRGRNWDRNDDDDDSGFDEDAFDDRLGPTVEVLADDE